jgi:hypothetical protein
MSAIPLAPMLVQYLVGLCCLKWDPDAIDVTIGDMVVDTAAGKERDVDVTVTVTESGSTTHAFKAYEVKREGAPLDVTEVEALCLKLMDMPSLTHRAIVSASDFTDGAQAKAAHHGVELFGLRPWTRPLQEQFPSLTMQGTAKECFPMSKTSLCWVGARYALVACDAKGNFTVQPEDRLLDRGGEPHSRHPTFAEYQQELLLRSTEILFPLEPAATVFRTFPVPFSAPEGVPPAGPAWPHTHTLDVSRDDVYVTTVNGICRLDFVTITGQLQWQRSVDRALYYVIERVPNGDAFAGALISTEMRDGHMTGLVFSPKTREVGVHFVRLAEKHRNAIRKLKLDIPIPTPEAQHPLVQPTRMKPPAADQAR